MQRIFRSCLLWIFVAAIPALSFSQTPTRIDGFSAPAGRPGVLIPISAVLHTSALAPVSGVALDFQINDGSGWRSITDDLTVTSNVTDATGRASVAFLAPENMTPGSYPVRAVFSGTPDDAGASVDAQLSIEQPKCSDEGVVFNCAGAWEVIRIANHRTSSPGIPLILVHGNGMDDERNRSTYFGWAALRQSILESSAYAPFDVFIWKHDTARAIGFNGKTGNAADLADYINNHLLPRYPAGVKLLFVAHSRGGLVVRSFMNYQNQGDRVLRLVTLGAPHHGTPFAVPDWAAMTWAANVNNDASVFDQVYSFAFDVRRLGSLGFSWDDLDGAVSDPRVLNWTSAFSVNGQFVLTVADLNSTAAAADSTIFYSSSIKAAFGTLAELNQNEKYLDRIVRYGAFDDSLGDNDDLMKQAFSSVLSAYAIANDSHKALQAVTALLARSDTPLQTTSRYFANDGLVPLQSALGLDIAGGTAFSQIDNEEHVSLQGISTFPNCGPQSANALVAPYRVWWGSRDQIRDHLDLLETTNPCYWQALALDIAGVVPTAPTTSLQFGFPSSAGLSATTTGEAAAITAGYVDVRAADGAQLQSGFAIYGLRTNGVLISETAVEAAPPISSGRIYAETGSATRTGLALANPNDQDATVSFYFTDQNGVDGRFGSVVIPAHTQIARFLDEAPFNGGVFTGAFTFTSNRPVAALGLRGYTNERSEFLMTTLPVAPLASVFGVSLAIPHYADGGGWSTSVLLVNPTDLAISGNVEFLSSGNATTAGQPRTIVVNGQSGVAFPYSIPARSSIALETGDVDANLQTGWIRITPGGASATPVGLAIFRLRRGGVLVSETGITGQLGASLNVYVETSAGPGGAAEIQSGLALANPSASPVNVTLELSRLGGAPTGLSSTVTIPAQGQLAAFLTGLPGFEDLPLPFQGILTIRSSAPLSVIGLRGHTNERGDFLMATTPPFDNGAAASGAEMIIPHFVDGGGYTTQFIMFSGTGAGSSGAMFFLGQDGQPLGLKF